MTDHVVVALGPGKIVAIVTRLGSHTFILVITEYFCRSCLSLVVELALPMR